MKNLIFLLSIICIELVTLVSCKKVGCTDSLAKNFDSKANVENNSCIYTDINGNEYKSKKIGAQTWMTENLKVQKYRNGDEIPYVPNSNWSSLNSGAWCYFMNDPSKGILYNWYAVNDPRGLAPEGWHIPSEDEWTVLANYLGGSAVAGTKMKSTKGWNNNGNGNNESGFNGTASGVREFQEALFCYFGVNGYWWSSTSSSVNSSFFRQLNYHQSALLGGSRDKFNGMSVRCIRDK